ncbi:hypothetical protein [Nannocystis bainbridge]|uniref:Uncharacterized protein n=1 Tax=Nannocystis bainbridge TaxID=2995303 RepID=A0ABT5DZU8_9BACT|nr:hypothetical protein [Nannocystis bainbridge]MDC0719155.1 hypothetical protein [Nannocystis bainbridge]
MPVRALLALVLVSIACGHARGREVAETPGLAEQPQPAEVEAAAPAPEVEAAGPGSEHASAQVITFSGDDADPEPSTQIRSPPKRPPIPSFQLYGTRPTDGPR